MSQSPDTKVTPIFIPGLICTADLFAAQREDLTHSVPAIVADTLGRDSLTDMAQAALELVEGPVVPIGLSMGGMLRWRWRAWRLSALPASHC